MRHGKEYFDTWHEKRFNVCEYSGVKTINKKWKEFTRNNNWVTSESLNCHRALTPTDKRGKEPTRNRKWDKNWYKKLGTQGTEGGTTRKHKGGEGTKRWHGGQWVIMCSDHGAGTYWHMHTGFCLRYGYGYYYLS